MKKRSLFVSLVLISVLTALMPTAALAAKPTKFVDFNASGVITYITGGDVLPAGDSGRWRVIERELDGQLSGDINGSFALAYKANVELATQAGNLQGTLVADQYSIKVNGTIQPLEFYGWYIDPVYGIPLYYLEINGSWTFADGAQGNGDFAAYAIFIPTPDGHVYAIVASGFDMTGKWKP